jgi:AbrB family looped-hinge helix DNA binding protein
MARNISTVTRKGQVTIPIEIRRRLGIHEGDQVEFVQEENGSIGIVPFDAYHDDPIPVPPEIAEFPEDSVVRRIGGIASKYTHGRSPLTIEEMKAAAAWGWTERERRFQEQRRRDEAS